MSKIEEYLKQRPDLTSKQAEGATPAKQPSITINSILISATKDSVEFGYLNSRLTVSKADIIDVVDSPVGIANPFGQGHAVSLTIKADAVVTSATEYRASELVKGMPYALARPSLTADISLPEFTEKEFAWRAAHGLLPPEASSFSYSPTQSPFNTLVRTGDHVDGYNVDGYRNDDSHVDD